MQRHFPTRILLVYAPFHELALKLREIGFEQSPIAAGVLRCMRRRANFLSIIVVIP